MSLFAEAMKAKHLLKTAYIRKLPNGQYRVLSQKGKNLGTFDSHEAAAKHLGEVEYFKHKNAAKIEEPEETYSSILRRLNKEDDGKATKCFLTAFKDAFDQLVLSGEDEPAEKALPIAQLILAKACGE
jgi:hypothetical protein